METYDLIAVLWISWVGAAGIIITLISGTETGRKWSMKKTWWISYSLATVVATIILSTILFFA